MFSVIIASKDRAELLEGAIAASLDQTHPPGEVIVVDDGSTDGTPEVIDRWSDRGVTGLRTVGLGVTAARNLALRAASEEWVAFLDDDDRPTTRWLEQFASLADADVGIVSAAVRFDRAERGSSVKAAAVDERTGLEVNLLAGAFAVRRELLLDVGGYLDGLTYAEHSELAMRLLPEILRRGLRAGVAPMATVVVPRSADRRSKHDRADALLTVIDEHRETFEGDPERMARWMSIAGVDAYRDGDVVRARSLLWQAFRARPTPRRAVRAAVAAARSTVGHRPRGQVAS